jgi:hypothetical protein
MIEQSVITCPNCGMAKVESMPTDACRFFTTALDVACGSGQSRAIAAYSVLTARFPARRCKNIVSAHLANAADGKPMTKFELQSLSGRDWAKTLGVGIAVPVLTAAFLPTCH